jgi:hypothetical protein
MANKTLLEVLSAILLFVPFGIAVLYARAHGRTAPPFEVNLALFVMYGVIVVFVLLLERKLGLFKD